MRVAVYLRVSRSDQDPSLQENEIAAFVRARGWTITKTYLDHGISGARDRRPALERMTHDARRRRFDAVITYKSDRLFRSVRHMVNLLDELAALGVSYVSATEPLDTTTPTGKLIFHVVAAMAEFERALLIERTKAGMAARRRSGVRLGRPRRRVDLDRAAELRAGGATVRDVARSLGIGVSTLTRAMKAARGQQS